MEVPGEQRSRPSNALLAVVVFIVYTSLSVATLHRYGITQDEPEHWFFGDRYLQFFLTLDPKALDFSSARWPAIQTWPVGPTLGALTAKVFSEHLKLVDGNDGHHLASIVLFGLLLSSLYLFLTIHASRLTAVLSCLVLVLQPRILGEAHNNSQDIPHLAFYTLTILAFLHGMITYRAGWLLISGVCWGLALGSKINALSFPLVIVPMLIPLLWDPNRQPASIMRSLVGIPVIALSVLLLAWPYFWRSPLDHVSRFWSYLIFWGYTGPRTWQASPTLSVLITTPPPILAFALIGIVASARTGQPLGRRAILTLLMWLAVPIARSSLPGVLNYNVIRRFMEFSPALAIFAGIGGASLMRWITQSGSCYLTRLRWVAGAGVLTIFLSPVAAAWRYFPYESSYYNLLVGGLGGAQSLKLKESTNYTLTSYREGINWINAHADAGSFLLVGHGPHLISYYPLRKDLALTEHLWMDELVSKGRAAYLMYVPLDIYTYNMCLAETFLRPEYEIRRDGGVILRIYKLAADSHLVVTRDAFPPPRQFSATLTRRWVALGWEPAPTNDIVGHIVYYGRAPRQYDGAACIRGKTNQWEVFADVPFGTYYLSLSVLTRQAQESERTPDIRREYLE